MQPSEPDTERRRAELGATVKRLRQLRGLTQEDLADLAGFDRKSINRLENAQYGLAVDRLYPLADALGVPVAELFAEQPARRPRQTRRPV